MPFILPSSQIKKFQILKKNTSCVVVEIEFAEMYKGQSLFSEVEKFLRSIGFSFYGFFDLTYRSGSLRSCLAKKNNQWNERLIHADAVFFWDPISICDESIMSRRAHSTALSAYTLGYYDLFVEIVTKIYLALGQNIPEDLMSHIESLATSQSSGANTTSLVRPFKAKIE